jgi:PAS domain S-box-containing protein
VKKKSRNHIHRNVFLLSLALGTVVWTLDALFDYLFFYSEPSTFTGLLITDIPAHEIYIRTCALVLFAGFGLVISHYLKKHTESETRLNNIFNNIIPICITDNDFNIIISNRSYQKIFGTTEMEGRGIKCHDSRPSPKCKTPDCPLHKITREGETLFTCESTKIEKDGTKRYFVVTATPYFDIDDNPTGIIETFQDITSRRLLEKEMEALIVNLRRAMDKVKTLSGFLPICASCKKIRDDKGYWNQIESYIKEHSEAEFSHSICPDCAKKLYGDYMKGDKDQDKT